MTMESKIRLAAKLYEARETAKTLLGEKYAERMKEGADLLTQAGEETGKNPIAVATFLAKKCEEEGRPIGSLVILAAAVEMLEPST